MYRNLYTLFKQQGQIWGELTKLRPDHYKTADPRDVPTGVMAKAWYDALHSMRGPTDALALLVGLAGEKISATDRAAIQAEFSGRENDDIESDPDDAFDDGDEETRAECET